MDAIKNEARKYSIANLVSAIRTIGGGQVGGDLVAVRAALLSVYEERQGGDATDALMVSLGML